MVELTGIEPTGCQFRPVHLSLSVCKHVRLVSPGFSRRRYESATLSLGCHSVSPAVAHPANLLLARVPARGSRLSSIPCKDGRVGPLSEMKVFTASGGRLGDRELFLNAGRLRRF